MARNGPKSIESVFKCMEESSEGTEGPIGVLYGENPGLRLVPIRLCSFREGGRTRRPVYPQTGPRTRTIADVVDSCAGHVDEQLVSVKRVAVLAGDSQAVGQSVAPSS